MNLQRILTILLAVISVIGSIFLIMIIVKGDGENHGAIDGMLWFAKLLIIVTALLALVFSIKNIASDPQKMKKSVISLVGFLVILGIGYGLSAAGEEVVDNGKVLATASESKMVGSGIIMFYVLLAVALGAMLVTAAKKSLK